MSWKPIRQFSLPLALLAFMLSVGGGNSKSVADEPPDGNIQVRKLTVHPAPEPVPALKYQLLPDLLEREPGNAAVLYNRVLIQLVEQLDDETSEKLTKWAGDEVALEDLPVAELRETLKPFEAILGELAIAARRDSCQWDFPFRDGQSPFAIVLPELQQQRQLTRILVLNIRLAIHEGRIDDAIEMLKTGFAFARHVGAGPTLIHGLVGSAMSSLLTDEVEELLQQAGSPNLYWALAAMPRPLIDLRRGLETERHVLDLWMPDLLELDSAGNDPVVWEKKLAQIVKGIRDATGETEPEVGYRAVLTGLALKGYPQAADYMISKGYTEQDVASMHAARVLMVYTVDMYRKYRDGSFKWFCLPYAETREGMAKCEQQFKGEIRGQEVFPVASMLLPAIGGAKLAVARHDRGLEIIRMVEAIRMHAATHGGRLPSGLDEITDVPVVSDPMWGRPFQVSREGDAVVIESAPVPWNDELRYGLRVEVRLAK